MISAARKTSKVRRRGFTILEMVVVMAVAMLVIGGAIAHLYFSSDEARLNEAMNGVQMLSKRARTLSTLQQRPYALEFTREGIGLMPFGEATLGDDEREMLLEREAFLAEEQGPPERQSTRDFVAMDQDMTLLVRRWATGQWEEMKRNSRQVWRFDPEGICEPCGVRIELENGSWIAALFHPLTAGVTETESEIR